MKKTILFFAALVGIVPFVVSAAPSCYRGWVPSQDGQGCALPFGAGDKICYSYQGVKLTPVTYFYKDTGELAHHFPTNGCFTPSLVFDSGRDVIQIFSSRIDYIGSNGGNWTTGTDYCALSTTLASCYTAIYNAEHSNGYHTNIETPYYQSLHEWYTFVWNGTVGGYEVQKNTNLFAGGVPEVYAATVANAASTSPLLIGLSAPLAVSWMSGKMITVIGSGLGMLKVLLPYIIAVIAIWVIVFFAFRAFRFMHH